MKRNFLKSLFAATAVLAIGSVAAQAQSQQADTYMEVRVEIVEGCTVNLIGGMQVEFSPRTQIFNDSLTREVNVNCTRGTGSPTGVTPVPTGYELRLPQSTNGAPTTARRMDNAASDNIYYTVRRAPTCSSPLWGFTTGSDVITGAFPTPPGGNRHPFNICIDRQQNIDLHFGVPSWSVDAPPVGLYADTLQIQLWY